MAIKVITPPSTEPVTLAEARLHLRVDETADDALITGLITAAREEIERRSWHALCTQTLELVLDAWPCNGVIRIPRPPLQSVTSVTYTDSAGAVTTWSSSDYIVAGDKIPGEIVPGYGLTWPSTTLYPREAIRVRYTAGFGAAADVPQSLRQAVLLLVGTWYENREGIATSGAVPHAVPFAVDALVMNYHHRVWSYR